MKKLSERLKNSGTVLTITSLVILILTKNGVSVDNDRVMITVQSICTILVLLGILNNPETPGLFVPGVTKEKE